MPEAKVARLKGKIEKLKEEILLGVVLYIKRHHALSDQRAAFSDMEQNMEASSKKEGGPPA